MKTFRDRAKLQLKAVENSRYFLYVVNYPHHYVSHVTGVVCIGVVAWGNNSVAITYDADDKLRVYLYNQFKPDAAYAEMYHTDYGCDYRTMAAPYYVRFDIHATEGNLCRLLEIIEEACKKHGWV